MSTPFIHHQYHQDNHIMPSMEQDDNYSDTDTDTILYTPTSIQSTMYDPSTWLRPNFDVAIHPSQRPLSSPSISDTSKYNPKSKNTIDTHSFTTHRASAPPTTLENSTYSSSTDHYQSTIRRMSQHIDDFLHSRQEHTDISLSNSYSIDNGGRGPSSATGDFIEMVHQFRDKLNSDATAQPTPQQARELCDAMLAWLQHSSSSSTSSTAVIVALDDEKRKNKRLVNSIHQLAQRHHATKQHHRTEIKAIRNQQVKIWTDRLQQETQTRKEAEELLDSVRMEMETMIDELNAAKQQLYTAQQEAQQIRHQWESIILEKHTNSSSSDEAQHPDHNEQQQQVDPWALLSLQQDDWEHRMDMMTDEIHRLTKENEDRHDLKRQLSKAERQAAEYDLKLVVLKSQQKKQQQQQQKLGGTSSANNNNNNNKAETETNELITALQHELVEKKSALARWEKKWQQQIKQWDQQQAALHQSHLVDHQAWQEEYKAECQKQQDLDFLRVTRETRALEGQLVDASMENERLEATAMEHQQRWYRMDQQWKASETAWRKKQSDWDRLDKLSKTTVLELEQKVIGLEADAVRLYGKNIMLANQLGECD